MSPPAAFPAAPTKLGLGVGLDVRWGSETGFLHDPTLGDIASPGLIAYLAGAARSSALGHLFVSWQPRDRGRRRPEDYFPAYDHLFGALGDSLPVRALHHTALNLGCLEAYDRGELLDFTNALIDRYQLQWVNEDLGLWSLNGKSLPYPLPPYLTDGGLDASIRNVTEAMNRLSVPLLVEFPGFSEGMAVVIGRWHAFDYFHRLATETGAAVTLDTGHLLSYAWLRGQRGAALLDDIERLPLSHCFEVHLSGCSIEDQKFHDRHHGVLLQEQLDLLRVLLARCPNLRAVTYEDPVFDAQGALAPGTQASFDALVSVMAETR